MPSPMVGLGGMGARRHGGKLLHPCGESMIFRVLVGSHPLHAKACPYLWAGIVCGCILNERAVPLDSLFGLPLFKICIFRGINVGCGGNFL